MMSRIAELVNNLGPLDLRNCQEALGPDAGPAVQFRRPEATPLPYMRERALTVPTFYLRDARAGPARPRNLSVTIGG